MDWWSWLILSIFLLIAELFSAGVLIALFFSFGAATVGGLVWMEVFQDSWVQWLGFAVFSVSGYLLFRPQTWGITGGLSSMDRDLIIGKSVITTTEIAAGDTGLVEYRGVSWKAQNISNHDLTTGAVCYVVKLEGLTLAITDSPRPSNSEEAA